ncbi:hypothetical protein L227DRAFT_562089 [Lentinus tigrinus ALCF2SS1-6]|uniref:Phosphatidylglycerol/phosphatidylinositol transfer protein n=1 Tax=Lentinus tigrinus ALCF2SS1-6 TaxID=1328759 RepID=A0A5C2SI73_9APHY|nr:hypothetical protein L227DRAFT_562089 [Lentinus tigrinus ALCF2SS1-6]
MQLFLTLTWLIAFIASALAQRIAVGAPAEWTNVQPGQNVTVRVDKPNSLSGSQDIAIAIGLWPCGSTACSNIDVQEVLGDVVYSGPYTPQLVSPGLPPFQNFTVTVPEHFQPQQVSLSVAHFALIGAGSMPFMEVANITLIIPQAN